jgi:hypothetical protein
MIHGEDTAFGERLLAGALHHGPRRRHPWAPVGAADVVVVTGRGSGPGCHSAKSARPTTVTTLFMAAADEPVAPGSVPRSTSPRSGVHQKARWTLVVAVDEIPTTWPAS